MEDGNHQAVFHTKGWLPEPIALNFSMLVRDFTLCSCTDALFPLVGRVFRLTESRPRLFLEKVIFDDKVGTLRVAKCPL